MNETVTLAEPYSPRRVIALDVGNVCIQLDPERSARALGFRSVAEITLLRPAVWDLIAAVETGRILPVEFFDRLRQVAPSSVDADEVAAAWDLLLGPETEGMRDLVTAMVGGGWHPVLFSDISLPHYRTIMARLSFGNLVAGAVLSYQVGARKPDVMMYRAMEQTYCGGGPPALYVDDRPENVEAARERGWNALLFRGTRTLGDAFAELTEARV